MKRKRNPRGRARAGMFRRRTPARDLGISEKEAQRAIANLKRKGLLNLDDSGLAGVLPDFIIRRGDISSEGKMLLARLILLEYTEPEIEPTLLELAESLGTLVMQILNALWELQDKGLIVKRPARAWHVPLSPASKASLLAELRRSGIEPIDPDSFPADA